ncbi:MAG: type II toxin-antitoxin system VapC family toxin, partial [Gammaproteobacteria bacterium]|nr:type II toxin-antitoxin system VapC family toxin [Gammaproteobacteria bacterium]
FALKRQHGRLTANDCFCLIATQCHEGGILLTGDSLLRKVATELGVKVHGVLWVIKELIAADVCDDALLIRALKIWKDDATVFLPKSEIEQQLRGILSTL